MTKKYRIYVMEESEDNTFKLVEANGLLCFNYDSLQEAEDAIERYGYDYVNYTIQPIYRTDGD